METNEIFVKTVSPRRRKVDPVIQREVDAFYRLAYRQLLAIAMFLGAARAEAEDAVESVFLELLNRWQKIDDPMAYARRAVVSNFIKQKTRPRKLVHRLIERGEWIGGPAHMFAPEGSLTVWEDSEWVSQLLDGLPYRQREVMKLVVDEFKPAEVARLLGRSPEAIRQNLMGARRNLRKALDDQNKGGKEV